MDGGKERSDILEIEAGKQVKEAGKHSSPITSGIQNLPDSYIKRVEGTGGGKMIDLVELYEEGLENAQEYKGLWDEDSLGYELHRFFQFCAEKDVKPAKAGIRLWLGLSKSQYWEWENGDHGYKTNLLAKASDLMEMEYIGKIESYPTGNMFLLKSSHGHSDKQQVEISGSEVNSDTISETISKLGLDE